MRRFRFSASGGLLHRSEAGGMFHPGSGHLAFKFNCLESLTAIGIGIGACALAPFDAGLTAGAVIGGAGLFARLRENARQAGLDDKALIARMQKVILREWDDWEATAEKRDAVTRADAAMTLLLPQVMLTREELGATATASSTEPYPVFAARKVVDAMAAKDALFRAPARGGAPSLERAFALRVIERALRAAKDDKEYATLLTLDIAIELGRATAELREQNDATHEKLDAQHQLLLLLVEQNRLQAGQRGIHEETLVALAKRIAAEVGGPEEATAQLNRAIDEFLKLREQAERGSNLGELVDAALRRIAARNEEQDFDAGAREGERAYAELAEQEAALKAGRLKLIEANISQNRLRADAEAVAQWVCERVTVESGTLSQQALFAEIDRYRGTGVKRGLQLELKIGVWLARRAVETSSGDVHAAAQNRLGIATSDLGERTGGSEGLDLLARAVSAYRSALAIYTEAGTPRDWAMIQNNLGNTLQTQGSRSGGPEGLDLLAQAVSAFRSALSVYTETEMPNDWAMAQNNLGIALHTQGDRTDGPDGLALIAKAIAAHRSSLTIYTEAETPEDWAMTQDNLGNALQTEGFRTDGPHGLALLEQAVAAYHSALTVRTQIEVPAEWAATQNNLGGVLHIQGVRTGGPAGLALLEQAAEAYHSILAVRTEAEMPAKWAMTRENLALCFEAQADLSDPANRLPYLRDAEAALLDSLRIYTPEHMPYDYGTATASLARVREKRAALDR